MAEARPHLDPDLWPDVSNCITEDDTPVDGILSEKQMRLLAGTLNAFWKPSRPFVALANVGLFTGNERYPLVPDVMVSLDVSLPADVTPKQDRSYFIWRYGKPPDLVIEVVSNREGGEFEKAEKYARMGVGYYVIFDPEHHLGDRPLRAYELHGRHYVDLLDVSWLEQLGLGMALWRGRVEGMDGLWLRWCDRERNLLPMPEEVHARAVEAEAQAREAEAHAREAEAQAREAEARAREAEARAQRLAERLRELGLEE